MMRDLPFSFTAAVFAAANGFLTPNRASYCISLELQAAARTADKADPSWE
jgi:hypothetical protein